MPEESNQNQHSFDETNGSTFWDFLKFLIQNKQGQRVITGMAAILAATVLGTILFMRPEEIEISTGSGKIVLKKGSTQKALFLLSPNGEDENTPWVKTGIMVKKDDVINITASGRVHTSLGGLIAEAKTSEVGEPWVKPTGLEPAKDSSSLLPDRNSQMLLANDKRGKLLASVSENNKSVNQIEPIGENGEFTALSDGELVLTVNDIWLDAKDKNIYVPPLNEENLKYYQQLAHLQAACKGEDFNSWSEKTKKQKAQEQYQIRLKGWNIITSKNNWNIWYDDNIGSFSVSITVNEKE
jgi:hypothetical protein